MDKKADISPVKWQFFIPKKFSFSALSSHCSHTGWPLTFRLDGAPFTACLDLSIGSMGYSSVCLQNHLQGIQKATQLHFSFYMSSTQAAREDQIGLDSAGQLVTIDLADVHRMQQSEHELLRQLVQQFHVPKYLRSVPPLKSHA